MHTCEVGLELPHLQHPRCMPRKHQQAAAVLLPEAQRRDAVPATSGSAGGGARPLRDLHKTWLPEQAVTNVSSVSLIDFYSFPLELDCHLGSRGMYCQFG